MVCNRCIEVAAVSKGVMRGEDMGIATYQFALSICVFWGQCSVDSECISVTSTEL